MSRRRYARPVTAALAIAFLMTACSGEADPPPDTAGTTPGTDTASSATASPSGSAAATSAATTPPTAPPPASTSASSVTATTSGGPATTEPAGPRVLASKLEAPWSIAFRGDTPLVSERDSSRILELTAQGSAREVGTIEGVSHGGEGGLLGIAIRDDRELYAYSTAADGNRIQRFELLGEPGSLRLGRPTTILDKMPAAQFHNGGRIKFGPDAMLYATAGDAGERDLAQDREVLAGKILRMTPEGRVPDDNPFPGSLVYSYGHRNPQGIAWGPDGTMYAAEFGQNTWDELNVIEAGGNYGWPQVEGIGDNDDFINPVQQWATEVASPSGMAISGETIYLANLRGQRLRTVPLGKLADAEEHFVEEYGRIRDVVPAPDGSIWFVTNNTDGRGTPGPDDDRIIAIPAM